MTGTRDNYERSSRVLTDVSYINISKILFHSNVKNIDGWYFIILTLNFSIKKTIAKGFRTAQFLNPHIMKRPPLKKYTNFKHQYSNTK